MYQIKFFYDLREPPYLRADPIVTHQGITYDNATRFCTMVTNLQIDHKRVLATQIAEAVSKEANEIEFCDIPFELDLKSFVKFDDEELLHPYYGCC